MTSISAIFTVYPFFVSFLGWVATFFDVVGVLIVLVAASVALFRYTNRELIHRGRRRFRSIDALRYELGQRMILGLEFFLAGDIIRLIVTPTLEGLYRLGAIVTIRTILSYFLMKETDAAHLHHGHAQ